MKYGRTCLRSEYQKPDPTSLPREPDLLAIRGSRLLCLFHFDLYCFRAEILLIRPRNCPEFNPSSSEIVVVFQFFEDVFVKIWLHIEDTFVAI
jgi:hypothetical protein